MAKAVLVMDMPYDCFSCELFDGDDSCYASKKFFIGDNTVFKNGKPDWCPLREMPSRTNADRIRAMTDWQLAEFIHSVSCGEVEISVCKEECGNCEKTDSWCISEIAEFLQSESKE